MHLIVIFEHNSPFENASVYPYIRINFPKVAENYVCFRFIICRSHLHLVTLMMFENDLGPGLLQCSLFIHSYSL